MSLWNLRTVQRKLTGQSCKLSTLLVCLTASLLTIQSSSLKLITSNSRRLKLFSSHSSIRMASSASVKSESAMDTPTRLLLHERGDGSIFLRDVIGTKPYPSINGLKIISWNVAGLRGTLKKSPEVLNDLVDKEKPDILCLQETKLQNIGDFTDLLSDRGYKSYWTFSEIKKGYAGTVLFVKEIKKSNDGNKSSDSKSAGAKVKVAAEVAAEVEEEVVTKKKPKKQAKMSAFMVAKEEKKNIEIDADDNDKKIKIEIDRPVGTVNVEDIVFLFPDKRFNGEGRWVQLETPDFYFINTYVPNSGQNLERLDYRVDEWEPYVRDYLNKLREKKPVILSGDLNVAHTDLDVYNFQAKHLLKQAGTTLREKNAFSTLLSTGYEDALRYFYPDAAGQFTYWSQRTRARPFNKGLRLDYFVCSKEMFDVKDDIKNEKISINDDLKIENVKDENSVEESSLKIESSTFEIPVIVAETIQEENTETVKKGGKGGRKRKVEKIEEPEVPPAAEIITKKKLETADTEIRKYENPRNVKVTDCYILNDINDCSDHCPVILILQTEPRV